MHPRSYAVDTVNVAYDMTWCDMTIQVAYGALNPLWLIEWLELQRLLGVEMVGIYNLSINEGPAAQVGRARLLQSINHLNHLFVFRLRRRFFSSLCIILPSPISHSLP